MVDNTKINRHGYVPGKRCIWPCSSSLPALDLDWFRARVVAMPSSSVKVVSGGRGAEFFPSPLAPVSTLSQPAYVVGWEGGEQAEHGGKCPYLVTRRPGFCPLYLGEVPFPEPLLENAEVKTEEQECGMNMGKKRKKKVCDHVG